MKYYPQSQIQTDLYTNGGEFTLIPLTENQTTPSYIGFYYSLSNGAKFTGKSPNDNISKRLYDLKKQDKFESSLIETTLPITTTLVNTPYTFTLNNNLPIERIIPIFNVTIPTQEDKDLGAFLRYFCKKTNEFKYNEISKDTYEKLSSKSNLIAWDLFIPLSTLWYIKGDKEKIYLANKGLTSLIEQNQKWYGFSQYLKEDYLKYYQPLDISNLYTPGGEFTTKNGQNYIGFYHIHNSTIPMVGKIHTNKSHEVLIPILKSITVPIESIGGGGNY